MNEELNVEVQTDNPEASTPDNDAIITALRQQKEPVEASPPPPEEPPPPPAEDPIEAFIRKKSERFQASEAIRIAAERERIAEEKAREAERLKAETEKERNELLLSFRRDPVGTFKKLNLASEDVLLALAEANTPEYKQKDYLNSLESKINQIQKQLEEAERVRREHEAERERIRQHQSREDIHQKFVKTARSGDYPNLQEFFDDDAEIIQAGYDFVRRYNESCRQKGIHPQSCSDEDILLALEQRAEQRLAKLRGAKQSPPTPKKTQQLRTLTNTVGNDRRSTQRDITSLPEEEQRNALIEAAKQALMKSTG